MIRSIVFRFASLCVFAVSVLTCAVRADVGPVIVATANPTTGNAPLGVVFDASSTTGATTYKWEFGDGASSTAVTVTHVYTVAGTYAATLVVGDADGNLSPPREIDIVVNGVGSGTVSGDMNYRIAPKTSSFKINRVKSNADTFNFLGCFNTIDLPNKLFNLAASVSINGLVTYNGIMREDNSFANSTTAPTPAYFVFVDVTNQLLNVQISKANLAAALAATGAVDATIPAGKPAQVPVTLTLDDCRDRVYPDDL